MTQNKQTKNDSSKENFLHKELTSSILEAFYKVYSKLGYGFLERVYENAMMIELRKMGIKALKQVPINVFYEDEVVGDYYADIIVEDVVVLELKASEQLSIDNEYQLLNYLKATDKEVGLLLNFGKKPELRREIFTNDRKELR